MDLQDHLKCHHFFEFYKISFTSVAQQLKVYYQNFKR